MQTRLHINGKFDRFRITKNIHGQPGLINHHLALPTVLEMAFEFLPHG